MGNDGGGACTKAAERLPKEFLEEACAGDSWDDLYAKKCVAKDGAQIWAAQLNSRVEVLTTWGEWHLGEIGDWLVSRDDDRQNIYIIQETIFGRTYEKA